MSRKIELLYKDVFYKFITGKYGVPRIPTQKEVYDKVKLITGDDNDPVSNNIRMEDVNIEHISSMYNSIIDDLDVLYDSIEDQSTDILDQLTNSLKEHNGVKRELHNIEVRADDIQAGKLGKNYLQYVVTENFNSLTNINTTKTTTDPTTKSPIVDIKSGSMYIPSSLAHTVDLSHYFEKKLNIRNTDYIANIEEVGYVGHSDASSILNTSDPRRLVYRIKTDQPTPMRSSFILQLKPDGGPETINKVVMVVDPDNTSGTLRVQYKKDARWIDLPGIPATTIDQDRILLHFRDTTTTHLKFQFFKSTPDLLDSNEYFIVLYDIAILKATSHKQATLYSKSIKLTPYDVESPVVGRISAEANARVPEGTSVDVYVAKDKKVPGFFVDSQGEYVLPDSLYVSRFVPDPDGVYASKHILLSDIHNNINASGINSEIGDFRNIDYDWIKVRSIKHDDVHKPESVDFAGTIKKDPFDNSLFHQPGYYLFGDPSYLNEYGTYPQPDHPTALDPWVLSGVLNADNPFYPYFSGYLSDGSLISGVNYGEPTGYPFNYYNNDLLRTWRFGDYHYVTNGWWRPESESVNPTGYILDIGENLKPYPDFYFNNIKFYRIYKFEEASLPIESSIKLYTYQTRPVTLDTDYYPHNMVWRYNTRNIIKTVEYSTNQSNPFTGSDAPLPIYSGNLVYDIPLPSGGTLVRDSIRDVHYYDHSDMMELDRDYTVSYSDNQIDFSNLITNANFLTDTHAAFTYSYMIEDEYKSYWEGFILCDEDSEIVFKQIVVDGDRAISKIIIEDIDGNVVTDSNFQDENKTISINKGTYRLKVFCLSDPIYKTAKYWNPLTEENIQVLENVRIVSRIDPVRIVDFDVLVHSTPYENDNRAAFVRGADGFKYVVIKEPSKGIIPGYYFDGRGRIYRLNRENRIKNIGHYHRKYLTPSGVSGYQIEEYITGSIDNNVISGLFTNDYTFDGSSYSVDETWNNGIIYPPSFSNTHSSKLYIPHHTYGNPIDIEDTSDKGHLFYNTAENLPAFYTIEYDLVDADDPTNDRFLYKIELRSEHQNNTPVVDAVKFVVNADDEEL